MTPEEIIHRQEVEIAALKQRLKRRQQLHENDLKSRKTIGCRVDRETAKNIERAAMRRGVSVYRYVMQALQHEMTRP